jgi:hypothetical protein
MALTRENGHYSLSYLLCHDLKSVKPFFLLRVISGNTFIYNKKVYNGNNT